MSECEDSLGEIQGKLDRLLAGDRLIELARILMPLLTALVTAAVIVLVANFEYATENNKLQRGELGYAAQIMYENKEITQEQAEFLLEISLKSGITEEQSLFVNFLRGIVQNDSAAVAEATSEIIRETPDAVDSFVASATLLNENVNSGIRTAIESSDSLSEAKKVELADRLEFQNLLNAIEHAPPVERFEAMQELRDKWQDEPGFVKSLIKACDGKVQIETVYGVNVRLINTMDILRKLDPGVLKGDEDLVRNWLEESVFGRVGPRTTVMAKSLEAALNKVSEN